ncbi:MULTISPECIES: DUF1439 domain-containing protein [unclassified Hahella]|uniref:DUF1439 domain-containing protein n=1 Tax=unclassified Hahella TaxID=2624107 RepID=UPI000FDED2DD|nr:MULTISPECIES: DUF1439 domain-containing protein [unclassified Hahella]AZZ95250.1 DUF1439 domain-containing protein [Hahella sp. KA22]MDG9666590.1 DUF1439 domain-containing protein [Hahella sp. CR1]QAY52895.1 DUF1439 domain-containing protein [Hahella sp. KA22]WLQ13149.1 DUF1439 domain-containing protein [Hahella sp. HNIBRBA332]
MKKLFLPILVLMSLLSGCAALSPFSISEATLESYMQEQVSRYDRQQLESGSPLSLALDKVDVTLGPEGRDVAVLELNGEVAVNALMAKLPVGVFLKVEGAPYYNSQEKAVYIRRLRLLDSRIDSPYFKGDFKPVTDNAMRFLAQMLETMPVYRLDDANLAGQFMSLTNMDLKVAPGKLVFVPSDK